MSTEPDPGLMHALDRVFYPEKVAAAEAEQRKAAKHAEWQRIAAEVHEDFLKAVAETERMAAVMDARSEARARQASPATRDAVLSLTRKWPYQPQVDLKPRRWWQFWRPRG